MSELRQLLHHKVHKSASARADIVLLNVALLRIVSLYGILLCGALLAAAVLFLDNWSFSVWYLTPLIPLFAALAFSFLFKSYKITNSGAVTAVCASLCGLLLACAVIISIIPRADFPSAMLPLLILVTPSLFILEPLLSGALLLVTEGAFIALALEFKSPDVVGGELFATVASLLLSLVIISISDRLRMRNYKVRMKFRRLSMVDELTGILNKVGCESLCREYLASREPNECCALFMLDLDNLKQINDTLGHLRGDDLIEVAGNCLSGCFRDSDIIGRFGGDEFCALMTQIGNMAVIARKANQIQHAIQKNSLDRVGMMVSCSIGVAVSSHNGITYDSLFKVADSSLYKAKREGKRRCVVSSADTATVR
ncbi:MAG: GGDEF domain-containing protein [Oscillospiraceae bacterium]